MLFYREHTSWSYSVLTPMETFRSDMSTHVKRWIHVSQTSAEMCLLSENLHVVTSRSWYNFVETCRIGWTNKKLCSKLTNLNAIWIDIVDIGLLTINTCRVSSVNFVDIIVFAIVCIVVVVSICERLCLVLLVTLLWTMYWYMHWCVEFEKKIKKRISNAQTSLLFHMHAHTHSKYRHAYTNVTTVLLFEIDDNFSNVKVRMTMNDARFSVVVDILRQDRHRRPA